jgi:cell division protein FtsB
MKLIGKTDTSQTLLRTPVEGGEYTGFKDNFTASYKYNESLINSRGRASSMREALDDVIEFAKQDIGMEDYEFVNFLSDVNQNTDESGKVYTGEEFYAKRYLDLANDNPNVKQFMIDKGYDISSPTNLVSSIEQKGADIAEKRYQDYLNTSKKRTAWGAVGDFAGSVVSMMTDPADAISLGIGFTKGAGLVRKIAEATAINVGIEAFEYPTVRAWHQRVTGEDYSPVEFAKNAGIITIGTAGLVTLTNMPVRSYLNAVKNKINRPLTSKEESEAIQAFEQAAGMNPNNTIDKQLDKIEADEDITKSNQFADDTNNTKHNNQVLSTIKAILTNDLRALEKGPNVDLKTPEKTTVIEEQFQNTERMNANDILIDEQTFQFKGKTADLEGDFDFNKSGHLIVFEDAAGKRTVVDGHSRLKLAQKTNAEVSVVVLKEGAGFNKTMATMSSMVRNFYEGTIDDAGLQKQFKRYPELVNAIMLAQPEIKAAKALENLSARSFLALRYGMINEDLAAVVSRLADTEQKQMAAIDVLRKNNVKTAAEAEDILGRTNLDEYDMAEISKTLKQFYIHNDRNDIVKQMIKELEDENVALKKQANKMTKDSDQYVLNQSRRMQNEKTLKIIKAHGNGESEIADFITDGATDYLNAGRIGLEDFARTTVDNIRKGVDEGRFDRLSNSAEFANRELAAKIDSLVAAVRDSGRALDKYSGGRTSDAMNKDVETFKTTLNDQLDNNPEMRNLVIGFDADNNAILMKDMLEEIDARDAHIDFLKGCK